MSDYDLENSSYTVYDHEDLECQTEEMKEEIIECIEHGIVPYIPPEIIDLISEYTLEPNNFADLRLQPGIYNLVVSPTSLSSWTTGHMSEACESFWMQRNRYECIQGHEDSESILSRWDSEMHGEPPQEGSEEYDGVALLEDSIGDEGCDFEGMKITFPANMFIDAPQRGDDHSFTFSLEELVRLDCPVKHGYRRDFDHGSWVSVVDYEVDDKIHKVTITKEGTVRHHLTNGDLKITGNCSPGYVDYISIGGESLDFEVADGGWGTFEIIDTGDL